METRPSSRKRWLRWSVSVLMGVVATVAVLLACVRELTRPEFPAPGPVLEQLHRRMQNLRPGMTDRQVWRELGLFGYLKRETIGGGSLSEHWSSYHPGPGYHLLLIFDETSEPRRFVEGHLFDPQGVNAAPNPTLQRAPLPLP